MAKNTAINLDVTVNNSGYSLGGGGISKTTLNISGSDMTFVGGSTAVLFSGSQINFFVPGTSSATMPTGSFTMAGTDISNTFTNNQFVSGNLTITGSFIFTGSNVPTSMSSSGVIGQLAFNNNYIFICTGSNAWMRISASNAW
jgi:hypothetical protein